MEQLCAACLMLQAIKAQTESRSAGETPSPSRQKLPVEVSELPRDFGGYRLLRLLGRGGMGSVYEAEQLSTGRRLALKMLSQQLESAGMRGRFLREGRLAAGISHPNSLYIFGTEEIEGIPVITMEIAGAGTLADQLRKHGPLPVEDAVDVVLGLITGLEAAHAAGVLHRDVKPSNVFVNSDGSVKVGDFGLSVSTIATVDTFATATGIALGTPAYAAPEQLRGDELDVRADIYSVGATLFTLLSDRSPIEGKNAVQIVAAALDEKPRLLTELRHDVPVGLAQIVARCLAKKREQRYPDYAELRDALLPFSSETPQAAPLARRTLAYLVDELLSWFIPGVLVTSYYGVNATIELIGVEPFWPVLLLATWYVAYYTLLEGGWGAGLGKWLADISVARTDGRSPGHLRALIRAVIAWFARQGTFVLALAMGLTGIFAPPSPVINAILYFGFHVGLMLAPLITLRRRNGFATLWDILTGTRVVDKPHAAVRSPVHVHTQMEIPAEGSDSLGPYAIVEQIVPGWIAGIDPALQRQVWLRRRKTSISEQKHDAEKFPSGPLPRPTGELTRTRRDLARPGRARWQQSISVDATTWDVFEALPGVPLSQLCWSEPTALAAGNQTRPHWEAVRHWLYELTIEIAQAAEDGTLPMTLSLDHVWITETGRAMLLDEPWPTKSRSSWRHEGPQRAATASDLPTPRGGHDMNELIDVGDVAGRQRFIDAVAKCASPTTIPLHARSVLRNLATGSFDKPSFLAGNFRSLLNKPARFDRSVRAASLFAIPVVLIAVTGLYSLFAMPASNRARAVAWSAEYPTQPALNDVLRFRESLVSDDGSHDYVDIHLAGHYDYADFSSYADYQRYRLLSEPERDLLKQAVVPPPEFTSGQLQEADRKLGEALPEFLQNERQTILSTGFNTLVVSALRLASLIAFIQFVTLILFAATAGQYLFGFAVVDAQGEPAGRVRLLIRWMIAWSPFFLAFASGSPEVGGLSFLLLLAWCIGLAVAAVRPRRGLHDQLSGCWLVPR